MEQSSSESSNSKEEQLVQAFDSSALDKESSCEDLPLALSVTSESLGTTDAGQIQHSPRIKNGEKPCNESHVKRTRLQINKQMHPLEEIKDLDGKPSKKKSLEGSDGNGKLSVSSPHLCRQQVQGNKTNKTSEECRMEEELQQIPRQKRKRGDHATVSHTDDMGAKKRFCTEVKANGEKELEPYVSMKIFDSDAEVEKPKEIGSNSPLRRPAIGKKSRPEKGNSSRQALPLGNTTTKVVDAHLEKASEDEEPKTRVLCKQNKQVITTLHVEGMPSEKMVVLDAKNLCTSDMGAKESVCVGVKEDIPIEPETALSIKSSSSPKNISISNQQTHVDSDTKIKRPTDIHLEGANALSCTPVKGRSSRQALPDVENRRGITDLDATERVEPYTPVQCQHNAKQSNSLKNSPCKKIDIQNEREIRSKQVCVAKFRVGLNELREELEAAVVGQDFTRAQMVKGKIDSMEQKMAIAVEGVRELLAVEAPSSGTNETVAVASQEPPSNAAKTEGKEEAERAPKLHETSTLDKPSRMKTIHDLEPFEAPAPRLKDNSDKKRFSKDVKPYEGDNFEPTMSPKKVISQNSTNSQKANNTTVSDKSQKECSEVSREKTCPQKRMPSRRVSPVKDNTTMATNLDMIKAKTDDEHITTVRQSQKKIQSKARKEPNENMAALESLETLISNCKTSHETLKRLQPYVLIPTSPSKQFLLKNPHLFSDAEAVSLQRLEEHSEAQGKPMVAPAPAPSPQKLTKRGRPKLSNPSEKKETKSSLPSESIKLDSFKSRKQIETREALTISSNCETPKPTVIEEAVAESNNETQSTTFEKTSKRLSRKCATPQKESLTKVLDPQLVKALSGPKIVLVINKALLAEARKNRQKKPRNSLRSATCKIGRLQNELKRIVARKELRESLSFVLYFDIKFKKVTFQEIMKKKESSDTATKQAKKGEKEKSFGSRKSAREKLNTEESDLAPGQNDADSQPREEAKTITKGRAKKTGKQKDAKDINPGQSNPVVNQPKKASSQGSRRSVREQKEAAVPVKPSPQRALGKGGRRGPKGSAVKKPEGEMDLFYQICPLKPCCQSKAGVMQSSGRKGTKRRTGAGAETRPGKGVGLGAQGVTGAGGIQGAGAKRCMSLMRLARRPIQRRKIRFHAFIYNGSCLGLWKEDVSMGRIHIQLTSDEDGGKGDEGRRALNQPILSDLTNRGRVGKVK